MGNGRFTKGDPRNKVLGKKGGKIGGKKSPTNFRNNPELASKASKKQKNDRHKAAKDYLEEEEYN